jgi:hypothetical protein
MPARQYIWLIEGTLPSGKSARKTTSWFSARLAMLPGERRSDMPLLPSNGWLNCMRNCWRLRGRKTKRMRTSGSAWIISQTTVRAERRKLAGPAPR